MNIELDVKTWEDLFVGKVIKGKLNGQKVAEQWVNVNDAILIARELLRKKRVEIEKEIEKENNMSTNFINRTNDEEIIDIMNSILSNGKMQVETINEAILIKLMELRGTPIKYDKTFRNIDKDYERWEDGL